MQGGLNRLLRAAVPARCEQVEGEQQQAGQQVERVEVAEADEQEEGEEAHPSGRPR